jgi:alkylation response protein AidB-like acyl-CoA dehydrogenase
MEGAHVRAATEIAKAAAPMVDDIESDGRLPVALADALGAAGLFQLYVPASAGGP